MSKSSRQQDNGRYQAGARLYKVVILGQGGVGKSALTMQFVMHTFQEDHDPTIEDAYQKRTQIDDETCVLDVLDTAGQDEFTAMREQYMRGGEGFIMVYSVTERRSFNEMRRFKESVNRVRNSEEVPIVLIGNKCDLEQRREVSKSEGMAMGKEFGCPFFETSAALRFNVDETFHEIVRCIRRKERMEPIKSKSLSGSGLLCCLRSTTVE